MRKVSEILIKMREGLTAFMAVISSDHAYIHDGIGFSVNHNEVALASGAQAYLGFKTPASAAAPNDRFIHWRPTGLSSTESGIVAKIFEDVSYSDVTPVVPFNRNRLSTNTTAMQDFKSSVVATPAVTDLVVGLASVGSGGNPVSSSGGGSVGSENELVLKQDTNYVIELDNIGANTTTVSLNLFWYEEEKGLDDA